MKSRSLLTSSAILAILAMTACQPAPPPVTPTLTIPPPSPPAAEPDASAEPSKHPSTDSELVRRICGVHLPCVIRRERSAGVDREGRRLFVVSVYRGHDLLTSADFDDSPPVTVTPTSPGAAIGIDEGERSDTISTFGPSSCHMFEYWLVVREGAAIPAAQRLASICNEGHGAAGVGEDSITIADNTFEATESGGSNWRWSRHHVVELSPLRVRSTNETGDWTMGPNEWKASWSWDDFKGLTEWYSPPCDPGGSPPSSGPGASPPSYYEFASIPLVHIEEPFVASAWKTTRLGRCALRADATEAGGFLIQGSPGAAEDASLRVVAGSDADLFIEIEDDRFLGPSAKWASDDHLQIWLAKDLPSYMDHCLSPGGEAPRQWIVRVADGKVFAGAGKPRPSEITVERVATGNLARFHLRLPAGHKGITVAYADSDDGRTIERVLATSQLVPGQRATLGERRLIDASMAVCRIDGDKLAPDIRPPTPGRPVVD